MPNENEKTYAEKGAILGFASGAAGFVFLHSMSQGKKVMEKEPIIAPLLVMGCLVYGGGGAAIGGLTGAVCDYYVGSFFPAVPAAAPIFPQNNQNQPQRPRVQTKNRDI